eukprot:scaffold38517_cov155-Skeletonema_dohrnii-CCMP3373.AAC.1
MHVKFNQLINGKKESLLTVICASATTYLCWFGNCVQFVNDMLRFGANLPHGQAVASRTLKNVKLYPKEKLEEISAQLLWAYSFVANDATHFCVPLESTRIAQRFAGNLTDDEMKALLETLIEACRKGGRTAGKMRTEAADLVKQLRADGVCDTNEEAFELVVFYLSPEHASLWNGSVEGGEESGKMRTDAAGLVRQLREDGVCETKEEANDLLRLFLSPQYASLWNGSVEGGEESGKMRTDAADLVKQLREDGICETKEEANDLMRLFLSPQYA